MRLIVFSDSHGQPYYMRQALLAHPEADMIIFLGDGERDFDTMNIELAGRPLVKVKGNCDFNSDLEYNHIAKLAGYTVLCTHGYIEHVKHGDYELLAKAASIGADIVLYGHTHEQVAFYEDGVYVLNPGTISEGYYGIVDLTPKGIMTIKERI